VTNPYPGSEYPNQNEPPAYPPPPGYGTPQPGYGAPTPGYEAPPPSYGAPTPGYGTPQPGYGMPPAYGAPAPGYGAPMVAGYAPVSAGNSGLALASMIVALVSLCVGAGIGGIVAVVLGHMALNQINASGGMLGGRGQAMTGLILGYIEIGLTVIFVIFYVLVLSSQLGNLPQQ
jgi:hypothetical protein